MDKNQKEPLVTIVTPSYNQGRYIGSTIESVLNQDYGNIEYIIMDGGSTDNTHEVVRRYGDRLTFISEKDKGQSNAINKGFKHGHGEIWAWLNSDDVYEENCISKVVRYFDDSEVGLVYGDGYIIDSNGIRSRKFEATEEFNLNRLINVCDYILQPTAFFRGKYVKEVGYLDESLNWCMDWDLWIRLGMHSRVVYIPEILASSREYEATKTSTGGKARIDEIRAMMQRYSPAAKPLGYRIYKAGELCGRLENHRIMRFIVGRYMDYINFLIKRRGY